MSKEKEQIKLKLIVMNFLQFFIWGAWLISMGRYMGNVMQYDGQEVGGLFATAGFAAIITPSLTGGSVPSGYSRSVIYSQEPA